MSGTGEAALAVAAVIPVFRMFSVEKAWEFYRDYLGCAVDWEHRFGPDMPLYAQVSRAGLVLHLSEHVGDATPGARAFLRVSGVDALHRELQAKRYRYLNPGIAEQPWGRELTLIDPFGNRLTFCEQPAG